MIEILLQKLTKESYKALQESKTLLALTHKQVANTVKKIVTFEGKLEPDIAPKYEPERINRVRQNFSEIVEVDWEDAQEGIYPVSLLFENDVPDFIKNYLILNLDLIQVFQRQKQNQYKDFSFQVNLREYPQYYRRNFHYQTDGYLSKLSADIYDLQVEILFNGIADPMRRRILKPLKESLQTLNKTLNHASRVLDVGCGTGRTLKFIKASWEQVSLFGIDLSPYYLKKAEELLSEIPGVVPQLVQGDASNLPYKDNYFQAVTNVFMFHELPSIIRQRVIDESFRVLQPGGILIICDSIQSGDSELFEPFLENFPKDFHEPYYAHYLKDDLKKRLEQTGFIKITITIHCVSKYWVAYKPEL
jgi:ubiquinone/menaquinone biosynthesis C-methylase UbiE